MFEQLPENFSYPKSEEKILEWWQTHQPFENLEERQFTHPWFSFYEGPPTVNGHPGIHHILARTIKDAICRYKTMRGYYVRRQAGWDTHGLPVELAVEKELGITQKSQIDSIGVAAFNDACRSFVDRNIKSQSGWKTLTQRMGYWLNTDDAYITCTNNYIESVWWALQQFHAKGLITKGFKVVPMSPTLGTPLSSHELSQNYKDVRDPNVYIHVAITKAAHPALQGAHIVVWTTTPWTLFANVALAVGPAIEYSVVNHNDRRYVVATSRLELFGEHPTVEATLMGHEIVGTTYEQIFSDVPIDTVAYPNALSVLPGAFVTTTDGSGVVHLAPAFGQDDFEMSKIHHLPMLQPVTQNGRFTPSIKALHGRTVKTFQYSDGTTEEGADRDIVKMLKGAGKIFKSSFDYLHSYPHCWRTDNPVIYYARESWFIASPSYKHSMVDLNKTIQWHPPEIGEGRFGNWLEDVKDWSLSRDRYWGTPLPLWVNEQATIIKAVGSIDELCEGMYVHSDGTEQPVHELRNTIDLHRQFVDNVVFYHDGQQLKRVSEVIDVWFDSGCMPFAQFHYPFENKETFDKMFPAQFIAEGIDQTRGWFYTMHNISTALFSTVAYEHVIVNDLVLDKNGVKMSKSKGNTVDPFSVINTYGADATRWYMMSGSPPWKTKLFNQEDIARTVIADFFRTVTNTYNFFALYAGIDGFERSDAPVAVGDRPEIDRWIISRLNTLIGSYTHAMDGYDITTACRLVQEFMIEEVSNWYVRRNRRRFWKGEYDSDKRAAYHTLLEVLDAVTEMMAPVAPFLSETLHQLLHEKNSAESIHSRILQSASEEFISHELEQRMAQAQVIVFLARSLREKAKIKTRQPLRRILVPVESPQQRRLLQMVEDIIIEEINVKSIEYVQDDTNIVRRSAKPNFKVIGKKYGGNTQQVANAIKLLSNDDVRILEQSSVISVNVQDETIQIDYEDVEIISEDIEGWLVATERGVTVALDTEVDDSLLREGLAREFVSKLQKLRKDTGLEVTDRISVNFETDEETAASLLAMRTYIAMETLTVTLERGEQLLGVDLEINGRNVNVRIQRV
jgi:isoleucyl-tRNA synthetase